MKQFKSLQSFFFSFTHPDAARDWFAVLLLAAFTLLGLTLYASYLFFGIESGSIFNPPSPVSLGTPSVSRTDLETVLTLYRARQTNYNAGAPTVAPVPGTAAGQ